MQYSFSRLPPSAARKILVVLEREEGIGDGGGIVGEGVGAGGCGASVVVVIEVVVEVAKVVWVDSVVDGWFVV